MLVGNCEIDSDEQTHKAVANWTYVLSDQFRHADGCLSVVVRFSGLVGQMKYL